MEKHTTKKFLGCILALSAGFILAACDPISAAPANYKDPIVSYDSNEVFDDNNIGTLYDSIATERNAKVVNKILKEIAEKKFGSFKEFLDSTKSTDARDAFLNNHKEYFGDENDTNRVQRYNDFSQDVAQRVSEYFYNEITSGSYNDDQGRFSEKKLYNAHLYELYDLGTVAPENFKTFYVTKELTKDNAFTALNSEAYLLAADGQRGYVKEKVYPDILTNKLVEDYIYANNYNSLGRAYARNVNYVKISYDDGFKFAESLMENFAALKIEVDANDAKKYDVLADAYKGFKASSDPDARLFDRLAVTDDAYAILSDSQTEGELDDAIVASDANYKLGDFVIIPAGNYYKESKIGKILVEYQKAIKGEEQGRFATSENKAALDSFTSDGKSKQYGLLQKVVSLMKEDYTTDGWYVKNGGLSELPSALRDRLFNIRVSNSLDDGSLIKETVADDTMGAYEYIDGDKNNDKLTRLPYLRNVYGKKLVLPTNALSYNAPDNDHYNYVYHDRDAKAFYICEVLEAPSTAKLNKESASAYKTSEDKVDTVKIEQVARQVAKILGTKDSYIKDAYTEYLNKYEFTFYDSSLYDYLKSEYPDLDMFEE